MPYKLASYYITARSYRLKRKSRGKLGSGKSRAIILYFYILAF